MIACKRLEEHSFICPAVKDGLPTTDALFLPITAPATAMHEHRAEQGQFGLQ